MSDVPPTSPAPVLVRVNRTGPLTVPCRLAGLDILSFIGAGGMGAVYKARDAELDCLRAVKVLSRNLSGDPQYIARFRQEARLAARLDTPCAVRVLRAGEENGLHYLVMEYAGGPTLQARCAGRPLSALEALHLATSLAEALREAHGLGIIHRDIKPANIIYTSDGSPKLADFGIARPMTDSGSGLTGEGATIGTPEYMPPEQAQGRRDLDGRADLYSLGATLYWAVTGRPPFVGERPSQVIELVINSPLVPPVSANPAVPPPLSDLIVHLMAKDRDDRPASAEDLLREIGRVKNLGSPALRPRRRGWAFALKVTAGLAAAASLAVAIAAARRNLVPGPQPPPAAPLPVAAAAPASAPVPPLSAPPIATPPAHEPAPATPAPKPEGPAQAQPAAETGMPAGAAQLESAAPEVGLPVAPAPPAAEEPASTSAPAKPPATPAVISAPAPQTPESRPAQTHPAPVIPPSFVNAIGMRFVLIPAGEAYLGSAEDDPDRQAEERPYRRVEFSQPFYISACEVTNEQFKAFKPDHKGQGHEASRLPAVEVAWSDAQEFCRWLSARDGRVCRLPCEDEWEYACRAGSRAAYAWGNRFLPEMAWRGAGGAQPAGSYAPNAWGVHDMHGNVWEWVSDAADDSGRLRVIRGGGPGVDPKYLRAAFRTSTDARTKEPTLGFRVLCEAAPPRK